MARLVMALLWLALVGAPAGAETVPSGRALPVSAFGHVAFVLPDGRPAMVDPVSGTVTVLSTEPQIASFPAWAPDGERVAFGTLTARAARVDVVDARRAGVASVYSSPSDAPIYVSWGPSGDLLAMLAVDREGLALHLVDVAAATSRLFSRGNPFFWSWSHDGDRLLVHRDVLGVEAVVGFTGLGDFDVRDPLPDPGVFQSPALSPSERYVAYATLSTGDVRRVVVAAAPGSLDDDVAPIEKRELPHAGQAALAWHPRLDLLAVQRGKEDGFGALSLLDAVTGDLEHVVDGLSLAFFWSPDGESIAYLTLQLGSPGFGDERQVSASPLSQDPELPRLTIHVFDLATGVARELADFVPTVAFIEQYLPVFDQYARSHRVWSPASDALVFAAVGVDGQPVITLFGLDGSVTPLAAGEMPSFNVR
jgi:TolB protein